MPTLRRLHVVAIGVIFAAIGLFLASGGTKAKDADAKEGGVQHLSNRLPVLETTLNETQAGLDAARKELEKVQKSQIPEGPQFAQEAAKMLLDLQRRLDEIANNPALHPGPRLNVTVATWAFGTPGVCFEDGDIASPSEGTSTFLPEARFGKRVLAVWTGFPVHCAWCASQFTVLWPTPVEPNRIKIDVGGKLSGRVRVPFIVIFEE